VKVRRKPKPFIATFDAETDPFDSYSLIAPFCFGCAWLDHDGVKHYREFWGDECVGDFVGWLETMPPMILYAHNGGKFDFMFILEHIHEPFLIGSRIVKAKIHHHEIRDSYSILPVSLGSYQKESIDYQLMTKEKREDNKKEILAYLASDCENLLKLVSAFRERFGNKLTIASTAITELEKIHDVQHKSARHDEAFREFYLGGRVECFEFGECKGDFKIYDVNSMYPHAMKNFAHPRGDWEFTRSLDTALAAPVSFIDADVIYAKGFGVRHKVGLEWGETSGRMALCSHEVKPALARGELKLGTIYGCRVFNDSISFAEFVDYWIAEKIRCELSGDKEGRLFAKLILNSAYGKMAQNPENFKEYVIVPVGEMPDGSFEWEYYDVFGTHEIYRRPNPSTRGYIDVSIGASITSASRAVLAHALSQSTRAIYCDTDSIICENLESDLHNTRLGAWKTEAVADKVYIAGKKLYTATLCGREVKSASKGVRLNSDQIKRVALGEQILWRSESPTFKFSGQSYIQRNISRRF
jgi:DNA polymerase type B, organellar and viral